MTGIKLYSKMHWVNLLVPIGLAFAVGIVWLIGKRSEDFDSVQSYDSLIAPLNNTPSYIATLLFYVGLICLFVQLFIWLRGLFKENRDDFFSASGVLLMLGVVLLNIFVWLAVSVPTYYTHLTSAQVNGKIYNLTLQNGTILDDGLRLYLLYECNNLNAECHSRYKGIAHHFRDETDYALKVDPAANTISVEIYKRVLYVYHL